MATRLLRLLTPTTLGKIDAIKHGDIAQYDYSWDAANRITAMNDAQHEQG